MTSRASEELSGEVSDSCSDVHHPSDFEELGPELLNSYAEEQSLGDADEILRLPRDLETLTMTERLACTASDLTSDQNESAIFVYSVESCGKEFPPASPISLFYQHTSNCHEAKLYQLGLCICEFGYELGFANGLARHIHYRDGSCTVTGPQQCSGTQIDNPVLPFKAPFDGSLYDLLRYGFLATPVPEWKSFERQCTNESGLVEA
jgi:hypothetical protein